MEGVSGKDNRSAPPERVSNRGCIDPFGSQRTLPVYRSPVGGYEVHTPSGGRPDTRGGTRRTPAWGLFDVPGWIDRVTVRPTARLGASVTGVPFRGTSRGGA